MMESFNDVCSLVYASIATAFGVQQHEILPTSSLRDDFNGDSLDLVELVMDIEAQLCLTLQDDEVEKVTTVAELVFLVLKQVKVAEPETSWPQLLALFSVSSEALKIVCFVPTYSGASIGKLRTELNRLERTSGFKAVPIFNKPVLAELDTGNHSLRLERAIVTHLGNPVNCLMLHADGCEPEYFHKDSVESAIVAFGKRAATKRPSGLGASLSGLSNAKV